MSDSERMVRDLVAAATGALVGGLVVVCWYSYHNAKSTEHDAQLLSIAAKEVVPMVYCAKDIPAGTAITLDELDPRPTEVQHLPASSISDVWVAVRRVALHNKRKGEPLYFEDVGLGVILNNKGDAPPK